jgi:hypothetical protein
MLFCEYYAGVMLHLLPNAVSLSLQVLANQLVLMNCVTGEPLISSGSEASYAHCMPFTKGRGCEYYIAFNIPAYMLAISQLGKLSEAVAHLSNRVVAAANLWSS